jgi:uncharacterized damage-inducible protein DinB
LLYEHEKDSNHKMLDMIESVPEANPGDARFQQAVTLADHMAAGRQKWLEYMDDGDGTSQLAWRNDQCDLSTLRPRFAAVERKWTDYLARLEESQLAQDFEFVEESNGQRFPWRIETIIIQMIGHAPYHRGQVALLVDQLGGETVDTDYAGWWWWNVKEKS